MWGKAEDAGGPGAPAQDDNTATRETHRSDVLALGFIDYKPLETYVPVSHPPCCFGIPAVPLRPSLGWISRAAASFAAANTA